MDKPDAPSPRASTTGLHPSDSSSAFVDFRSRSSSIHSRRPSIAAPLFLDLPGTDASHLEALHASSVTNPGLTTFGLGSPTPANSDNLTFNRLVSRVKSVAQGVKETFRDAVVVGGGSAVASALSLSSMQQAEQDGQSIKSPTKEMPAPPTPKRKLFGFGGSGQPFYQRHHRATSSSVSITSVSSAAEPFTTGQKKPLGFAPTSNPTSLPTSPGPTTVPRPAANWGREGSLDSLFQTEYHSWDPIPSTPNPYEILATHGSGVIQFPETEFEEDGRARARDDDAEYDADDMEDYDQGSLMDEEGDGNASEDDGVLLTMQLPAGQGSGLKTKNVGQDWDGKSGRPEHRLLLDLPTPSTEGSSLKSPPAILANEAAQAELSGQKMPVPVEQIDSTASPGKKTTKTMPATKPRRPKPISRLSENHLLPGFAVAQDTDDSDSSPTTGSVAATTTAGDRTSSNGTRMDKKEEDSASRNDGGGSLGFTSWFRGRSATNGKVKNAGAGGAISRHEGVGVGSGLNVNSEAVTTALRQLRSGNFGNLSKEFWMKDENCKECFLCNATFTTWRRRHHCRICGQIFCGKCTTIISGDKFGYPGSMRVCLICLKLVNEYEDESSADDYAPSIVQSMADNGDSGLELAQTPSQETTAAGFSMAAEKKPTAIPLMAIPASRTLAGNPNRRSAILEISDLSSAQRPSSAHSVSNNLALSRPHTASSMKHAHQHHGHSHHHRHASRSYHRWAAMPHDKSNPAPFHRNQDDFGRKKRGSESFHQDSIIDPELAPYMVDDATSDEQPLSIFSNIAPRFVDSSGRPIVPASNAGDQKESKSVTLVTPSNNTPKRARSRSRHLRNGGGSIGSTLNLSLSSTALDALALSTTKSNTARNRKRNSSFISNGQARPITRGRSHRAGGRPLSSANLEPPQLVLPLNAPSIKHIKDLLGQLLTDAEIQDVEVWKKVLYPILIKATDDVTLNVKGGDDMNIGQYVKIKCIPGGRPSHTSYISGIVFSKNLALKAMSRNIQNPNILVVTFPIEYSRGEQFMSLEPIISQEREYLKNLVNRIANLRPSLLLAQENVSGLALGFLQEAGIATAYNVKPSVIEAVSRCTQADVYNSVDKLALNYHLGRCDRFDINTFASPEFAGGKKTFTYLSGCRKDLGCTIVLRGETTKNLKTIKKITELMVTVVYSLKLESSLMMDEFVAIPSTSPAAAPQSFITAPPAANGQRSGSVDVSAPMIQTTTNGVLATSTGATSPIEITTASSSISEHSNTAPTFYEDMVRKYETKILSASPFVKYMQPYLLTRAREFEQRLRQLRQLRDRDIKLKRALEQQEKDGEIQRKFLLVQPEMLQGDLRDTNPKILEVLLAIHDAEYDKAYHIYQTQKRQWEAYLSQYGGLFDPFQHQSLVVLYSVINTKTGVPCLDPVLCRMYYYQQYQGWPDNASDCTLGQYIEKTVSQAYEGCVAVENCENDMLHHHRSYVHGHSRISVLVVDNIECPIKGMESRILMWSYCKICSNKNTPVINMSDATWKYSFAKYLELSFWSKDVKLRAGICPHDLHRDYVRCFAHEGLTVMFQYDPVDLYEIVVPRTKITYKPELDLRMKNEIYLQYESRIKVFYDSIKNRLDSIKMDGVEPDSIESCQAEIERMRKLAQEDSEHTILQLQKVYTESLYYEIIPLNQVLRDLQQKVMFWEETFSVFEKDFWPSEKDLKRLASQQIRKLFVDRDVSASSLVTEDSEEKDAGSKAGSFQGELGSPEDGKKEKVEDEKQGLEGMKAEGDETPTGTEQQKDLSASVTEESTPATTDSQVSTIPTSPTDASTPQPTPDLSRAVSDLTVSTVSTVSTDILIPPSPPASAPVLRAEPSNTSLETTATDKPDDSTFKVEELPLTRTSSRTSRGSFDAQRALPPSGIPRLVDSSRRNPPPASLARLPSSQSIQSSQSGPSRINTMLSTASGRSSHTINVKRIADSIRGKAERMKPEKKISERLRNSFPSSSKKREEKSSGIPVPRSIPPTVQSVIKPPKSKVWTLTKHFEQISREFEKERKAKQREARQSRVFPIADSRPIVEVFQNAQEAAADVSDDEDDVKPLQLESPRPSIDRDTINLTKSVESADALISAEAVVGSPKSDKAKGKERASGEAEDEKTAAETLEGKEDVTVDYNSDGELSGAVDTDTSKLPSISDILESSMESSMESKLEGGQAAAEARMEIPKHERVSLISLLTKFWAEKSSSGWPALEYPLSPMEHVFSDSAVIVREDEPSSLIAFTLSSNAYKSHFTKKSESVETASSLGPNDGMPDLERSLLNTTATHLKYQFNNGNAKMFCKVFYAEHFDALRRKCGLADRYVESLSRCIKWDSKGGKTKSVFLKTLDDRIIIKALQTVETTAFLKFANSYFQFMSEAFFHELPTVIAKMLGFYQISIRNPVTGTDIRWDVLVMENLFYDRKTTRRFDLKGSIRNRYAQVTGEFDEVLLDVNMVEFIYESPLFVREHSKKLLRVSLWNDTLFLAKHNIMDYSLMIGFDEDRKELIVGIIDCIRTYTWDKRFESIIKSASGNNAGKRPTVITPKEYKSRFREAMERYILEAPNCWHLFRMHFMQVEKEKDDVAEAALKQQRQEHDIPSLDAIDYMRNEQEPTNEVVEGDVMESPVEENAPAVEV